MANGTRANNSSPVGVTNAAFDDADVARQDSQDLEHQVEGQQERDTWGNPIEFLMSCISMSVGLGNIWRFPFTAYQNGGGAFLIPYLVVLLLIGKPLYFLEMILGQFSSRGSVKVWQVVPIVKGIGYGQAMATWWVVTYYCYLMALTVFYFFASFQAILPWMLCDESWADERCFNSGDNITQVDVDPFHPSSSTPRISSVDQYFSNNVLQKIDNIDNGIGDPEWRLSLCLLFAWVCVCLVLIKGVASSGKVAYFTAIFPYVVLITLLIRGVTLEGAAEGILYFIRPQWDKVLDPKVWYAAVTQCFFSLSVGFGPIIVFSSYNPFKHSIYRDATIVSLMDTFTSLLAGVTIFAILGNLAHETGKSIDQVVAGGTGLAFVSYPEAIGKFDVVPQLFAVLFFLMLFTLGIGSATSLIGCVITVICDDFPHIQRWKITIAVCTVTFFVGLVYVTPGGLFVMDVVDFFGGGFIIYVMAVIETIAICWCYGLKNFLRDVEFMLGIRLGIYWTFSWGIFIPILLLCIFVYSLVQFEPFKMGDYFFPTSLIAVGWVIAAVALLQIPIWALIVLKDQKGLSWTQKFRASLRSSQEWGPADEKLRTEWRTFCQGHVHDSWLPVWVQKLCKLCRKQPSRTDGGGGNITATASTISIINLQK